MRLGLSLSGRAFSVNPVTSGLEAWGRRREGCVRDMAPPVTVVQIVLRKL